MVVFYLSFRKLCNNMEASCYFSLWYIYFLSISIFEGGFILWHFHLGNSASYVICNQIEWLSMSIHIDKWLSLWSCWWSYSSLQVFHCMGFNLNNFMTFKMSLTDVWFIKYFITSKPQQQMFFKLVIGRKMNFKA